MNRRCRLMQVAAGLAFVALTHTTAYGVVLFSENFDGVSLGGSVNERIGTAILTTVATTPGTSPIPGVWSNSAAGWTRNNNLNSYDGAPTLTTGIPGQGVADYGVDEWEGWTFPRKDFWQTAAGDQRRTEFTNGVGNVAVVDPDEYYDLGDPDDPAHGGYYNASMVSPSIPVAGGGFYGVGFDSSWRPEAFDDSTPTLSNVNNQEVEVIATFNDPANTSIQVTKWNSDTTSPNFKNNATNEHFAADGVALPFINAPAGATSMTLKFNIANAGNDWWWAIDNVRVDDLLSPGTVFTEDFEAPHVTLGDSVNERLGAGAKVTSAPGTATSILGTNYPTSSRPNSFTHTPPTNWNVTNTLDAANDGDNNQGVYEWEGWSFATPSFWTFADTQERQNFTKGTGVIAIADGDEWTDNGPGVTASTGLLKTLMKTPEISLAGVAAGELLHIKFDSSWRSEDGQIGILTALLDGAPTELFRWEGGANISADDRNRSLDLVLDPNGAAKLQLLFSYEGGNNWWWAVDNIQVESAGVPEPTSVLLVISAACGLSLGSERRRSV